MRRAGDLDPTNTAAWNRKVSLDSTKPLVESLLGNTPLDVGEYHTAVAVKKSELRAEKDKADKRVFDSCLAAMTDSTRRQVVKRAGLTGAWLSIIPSRENGSTLTAEEFRDPWNVRYNRTPPHIPKRCDGCGKPLRQHTPSRVQTVGLP